MLLSPNAHLPPAPPPPPLFSSPGPDPTANCCFNSRDLEMSSDYRPCRSTLIYLL